MSIELKPVGTRVAIEPDQEHLSPSGKLYIPETAAGEAVRTGVVVASGKGALSNQGVWYENQLQPGDRVAYRFHRATEVRVEGTEYHLIHEGDVLCSIVDDGIIADDDVAF